MSIWKLTDGSQSDPKMYKFQANAVKYEKHQKRFTVKNDSDNPFDNVVILRKVSKNKKYFLVMKILFSVSKYCQSIFFMIYF